jgi:hypothetical protein
VERLVRRLNANERDGLLPLLAVNLAVAIQIPPAEEVSEPVGVLCERLPQLVEDEIVDAPLLLRRLVGHRQRARRLVLRFELDGAGAARPE